MKAEEIYGNDVSKIKEALDTEFYTVKELRDELNKLIEDGFGDRLVLIPNPYNDYYGVDYVLINKNLSLDPNIDLGYNCVYLQALDKITDKIVSNIIFKGDKSNETQTSC